LYKAQSQDEDALVNAAANLHMVLVSKNGNNAGGFSGSKIWFSFYMFVFVLAK
jgi:hypothetical protein